MDAELIGSTRFQSRWGWGRGDQVAHFYVVDADPSYARSACSTRLDRHFQIGAARPDDERCRHCARSAVVKSINSSLRKILGKDFDAEPLDDEFSSRRLESMTKDLV